MLFEENEIIFRNSSSSLSQLLEGMGSHHLLHYHFGGPTHLPLHHKVNTYDIKDNFKSFILSLCYAPLSEKGDGSSLQQKENVSTGDEIRLAPTLNMKNFSSEFSDWIDIWPMMRRFVWLRAGTLWIGTVLGRYRKRAHTLIIKCSNWLIKYAGGE